MSSDASSCEWGLAAKFGDNAVVEHVGRVQEGA